MKFIITSVLGLLAVTFHGTLLTVQGQLETKLTPRQKDLIRKQLYECMIKEKIDMDDAEDLFTGHISGRVDRNTKCFANCILETNEFLVDGKLQPAVIKQKLGSSIPLDKLTAIMTLCGGHKGKDNCDTGYEIFKCFITEYGPIM